MDLLKLRQALQCHLGNAVLKCVLPESLDETKVTTPRALAEYLRLPEVSCAPRVPSAEQRRQMRELVEVRAKLVDFESILARVDRTLQALGEGDADRAEREKVEPLQHRRREAHELPLPGQQRGQLITRWRAADGAGSIADRMSCTRRWLSGRAQMRDHSRSLEITHR